ncbi:opossum isoform a [Anaeramoeba flamelloides]|uniref:Opossum isoform a n=1 Tax=Anaeramoeba flamelloides TaxID=1746091 RepID=A0AAV7YSV6_9EUKA|nr:opossum isoform a [Anaeramoeba flamelloides]
MNTQRLSFLFLFGLIFTIEVSAISFTIEPHKSVCFYQKVRKKSRIHTDFQVLKGGKLDINFLIRDPRGSEIYNLKQTSTGSHNFMSIKQGDYSFCFDNSFSTVSTKEVNFNFKSHTRGMFGAKADKMQNVQEYLEKEKASTQEHIVKLSSTLEKLSENIDEVRELQMYLKAREISHRNTSESTNSRILLWSLIATFFIAAASIAQITYLRNIFTKKRRV